MSTTTTSPRSITRSETSWCGLAPLGPLPTMMKSTDTCPAPRMSSAMSAPTSRSVRPGRRSPGTAAWTRSMAAPAATSAATSVGSLRMRRCEMTGPARTCSTAGMAARRASTFSAHMWLSTATRRAPDTSEATSAYGSSSSPQSRMPMPRAPTGLAWAASTSRRGATSSGSPAAGTTRQVRRSSGTASYPTRYRRSGPGLTRTASMPRSLACSWIAASRAPWSPPCMRPPSSVGVYVHRPGRAG